jgi:hypothetical protein
VTLLPDTALAIKKELVILAQVVAVGVDMGRIQDWDALKLQLNEASERIERIRQAMDKKP